MLNDSRFGLPHPGAHPATGEPYAEISVEINNNCQKLHRLPPSSPGKAGDPVVVNWEEDEDGEEYPVYRDEPLTEAEAEAQRVAYEHATAEWKRTGGVTIVPGVQTINCSCKTASGATADYEWDGSAWRLTQYSVTP